MPYIEPYVEQIVPKGSFEGVESTWQWLNLAKQTLVNHWDCWLTWLTWSFPEMGLAPVIIRNRFGFYHGFTMVLPWFYHGFTIVIGSFRGSLWKPPRTEDDRIPAIFGQAVWSRWSGVQLSPWWGLWVEELTFRSQKCIFWAVQYCYKYICHVSTDGWSLLRGYGVFHKWRDLNSWIVYFMENTIKMDDL